MMPRNGYGLRRCRGKKTAKQLDAGGNRGRRKRPGAVSPRTMPGGRHLLGQLPEKCENPRGAMDDLAGLETDHSRVSEHPGRKFISCRMVTSLGPPLCSNLAACLPDRPDVLLICANGDRSAVLQLLRSVDNSTAPRFAS